MTNNRKELIIVAAIVLIIIVVYMEGRGSAKERVIANTVGATPGFDGYALALEFSNAFKSGYFDGSFSTKVDVLKRLDSLTVPDLSVVYNSFARQFSKEFSGKTMKGVLSEEWLYNPFYLGKDHRKSIIEKLNAAGLP